MYSNIVKIIEPKCNIYGTGIIISENKVLTASHVIAEEEKVSVVWDKSYVGIVEYSDNIIAIISLEDVEFREKYFAMSSKLYFTTDELMTDSTKWKVEGYITTNLINHKMEGVGIYSCDNPEINYSLADIYAGTANNYQGLSGAPVIINGRAVGILQIQSLDPRGCLGVCFSSIALFKNKLPNDIISMPLYISELRQYCYAKCNAVIDKNKEIAKYIPEIFIEENLYKENLRYFSMPILFINKIIENLNYIDFKNINVILKKAKKHEIDFSNYPQNVEPDDYDIVVADLKKDIKRYIDDLEQIHYSRNGESSVEETYTKELYINNSLKWEIEEIFNQLNYLEYQFVLLTRSAGQGKTNFVCDFTENFLIKRGIVSLFFNASELCETPYIIFKRFLTIDGKYDEFYSINILKKVWERTKVPFVIVIDGLNENTCLPNFENHIMQSFKEWAKLPFLKVILTTRCELFEERFGELSQDNIGDNFFILDMSCQRDERFKDRIFNGYLQHFDVNIMRETMLDRTYDLLTNDTLLLRIFCEVNRRKVQVYMYDIYKYKLFESYYENKKHELKCKKSFYDENIFDQLINSICQYMIKNRAFNNIPRDVFDIQMSQLIDMLLEEDVIFKEEQIVKKGFCDEFVKVLSFTFDEFRDFCITRYLIQREDAKQSLSEILQMICSEHWIIAEGVEKYLFFLARTSIPDILPILEENKNYNKIYWENIWSLEDSDIKEQDICEWRSQFQRNGPYRKRLICYLLKRRNKEYFKNAPIDLLFEIMDELANVPSCFDDFIKTFFPISKFDRYNKVIYQKNRVFSCDDMVKKLNEGIENQTNNIDYYLFIKMSIYLYGMMPTEIKKMWMKALINCKDVVFRITNDFLKKKHIPVVIKLNLEDIYESLVVLTDAECINELYLLCQNKNKYQRAHVMLKEIWS